MISILCPTRGRPGFITQLVDTAVHTAHGPLQFVFFTDGDDTSYHYHKARPLSHWSLPSLVATESMPGPVQLASTVHWITAPRGSEKMSNMWNRCAEYATGDTLAFVDDEALFHTDGWDREIHEAIKSAHPSRACLIQPNDLIHDGQDAGYFFVHRTWLQLFGRLTPPHFTYGYADVWPMEVAHAAGCKTYLPEVVVENTAPKNQPPDRVHDENTERAIRDRPGDLYNLLQPERAAEVDRLRAYVSGWHNTRVRGGHNVY